MCINDGAASLVALCIGSQSIHKDWRGGGDLPAYPTPAVSYPVLHSREPAEPNLNLAFGLLNCQIAPPWGPMAQRGTWMP